MRSCAICERTLLMGERAVRFAPEEGAELVDVCPLCQETALEHGWLKEGTPTTPIDRRRPPAPPPRARRVARPRRARPTSTIAPPEPILRRLSERRGRDPRGRRPLQREHATAARSAGSRRASARRRRASSRSPASPASWPSPSPGTSPGTSTASRPDSAQPVRLERRGHELDELEDELQGRGTRTSRTRAGSSRRSRASSARLAQPVCLQSEQR